MLSGLRCESSTRRPGSGSDPVPSGNSTGSLGASASSPTGVTACHEDLARWLGLKTDAPGIASWDVFDAVLASGDIILLTAWRDHSAAEAFEAATKLPEGARLRRVRIVRDYGMFERREAPQYYPEVVRPS